MMFRSKEQIRRFRELVDQGKVSPTTFHKRLAATENPHELPDRVTPKTSKNIPIKKVGYVKVIK
jgi:hypothetical protein